MKTTENVRLSGRFRAVPVPCPPPEAGAAGSCSRRRAAPPARSRRSSAARCGPRAPTARNRRRRLRSRPKSMENPPESIEIPRKPLENGPFRALFGRFSSIFKPFLESTRSQAAARELALAHTDVEHPAAARDGLEALQLLHGLPGVIQLMLQDLSA